MRSALNNSHKSSQTRKTTVAVDSRSVRAEVQSVKIPVCSQIASSGQCFHIKQHYFVFAFSLDMDCSSN